MRAIIKTDIKEAKQRRKKVDDLWGKLCSFPPFPSGELNLDGEQISILKSILIMESKRLDDLIEELKNNPKYS